MIAEPRNDVFSMSRESWRALEQSGKTARAYEYESGVLIVVEWRYDPRLCASDYVVDRLSLYLSLKDSKDERVLIALEDMMKEMQW